VSVEDGGTVDAEEWLPFAGATPPAGILLVRSLGRTRTEWSDLPATLSKAGYRVLSIDPREKPGTEIPAEDAEWLPPDPQLGMKDVGAGLAWLRGAPGTDPSRLAVIGSSYGADLACVAIGRGLVRTGVALSPSRDRVHLLAAGTPLHLQSLLFLATSGDPGAEAAARRLSLETKTPKQVRILTRSSAQGAAILVAHPEASALILDWLHRTL
jgi:dienelactone hydrolase